MNNFVPHAATARGHVNAKTPLTLGRSDDLDDSKKTINLKDDTK